MPSSETSKCQISSFIFIVKLLLLLLLVVVIIIIICSDLVHFFQVNLCGRPVVILRTVQTPWSTMVVWRHQLLGSMFRCLMVHLLLPEGNHLEWLEVIYLEIKEVNHISNTE